MRSIRERLLTLKAKQGILLAAVIALVHTAGSSFAYTPPIGIPDPGAWGATHPIDGIAPSTAIRCPNWPAAVSASCYYVDNTHPGATDSSNVQGSPSKPRLTLPEGLFPAGTYIEVHGGPYTDTSINMTFSGTAENLCWLRGVPGALPTVTGNMNLNNCTYLIVENLDFNGGVGGCIRIFGSAANNVCVRNSRFRNRAYASNTSAVGMAPNQNGLVRDVVVYNNAFSELGDWLTLVDQDFHGIVADTYGRTIPTEMRRLWFLSNTFFHVSGNGVQVNAHSGAGMHDYLHHVYIGKNVGHALRQAPYWSKQASHVIISQNIAYDNRPHGAQPGNGIGYQYLPDNLWIIFNEIYDSSNGIRQSDSQTDLTHHAYIVGNKIYNIHPDPSETYNPGDFFRPGQAISLWQGGMVRYVVDNTIDDVHGGININYDGPVVISGNIISNINTQDFHVANNNARTVTTMDRNLLSNTSGTVRVKWGGVYTSLQSFAGATGVCTTCMDGDARFMDVSRRNYHLSTSSIAVNANAVHNVYDQFFALYGISIYKDFDGNPKSSGGTSNLGAFERQTGVPPPTIKIVQ